MYNYYMDIFDKLTVGIILLDQKQKILLWNDWMEKKTELKSEDVIGQKIFDVCPRFEEPKYQCIIDKVIETGQGRFLSGALHGSFFQSIPVEVNNVYSLQNLQIEQIVLDYHHYLLIQVIDVTCQYQKVHQIRSFIKNLEIENDEIRQAEIIAKDLAMHDVLTGLPNRLAFMNRLSEIIGKPNKNNDSTAIIYLDIDNFKYINDTHGHSAGDILLQLTADRLKSAIRATDLVARIAGDEFVILIRGIHSREEIIHAANRVRRQFSNTFSLNDEQIAVTCSFGISMFPLDGEDPTSLIDKADVALYRVKKESKGGYQFYSNYDYGNAEE